jgi:CheY-like chemotaxis protein
MARISVVNDYPEFLEAIEAILDEHAGHDVTVFDGQETTIDELATSQPELVIVDLTITEGQMMGWDLLLLARADDRLRDVPLIVCSGDVDQLRARAEEFERIGKVYTLEKPFGIDALFASVNRALGT